LKTRRLWPVLVLLLTLLSAAPLQAKSLDITIVSVSTEDRSSAGQSFAGITVEPQRPVRRAVELALYESRMLFSAFDIHPRLHKLELSDDTNLRERLSETPAAGLLILDLPLALMETVARLADELERVAVNVRHRDIHLRESLCLRHLFHTVPSDRMYFDALGQFLVYRGWRKVLVVRGPSQQDESRTRTLIQSLQKFGATIEDERVFTLSHHPDDRDDNRPEFLTGGVSYDVVAVIDSEKDYGRYLQYSTRSPRPVVGDVGLTPFRTQRALSNVRADDVTEQSRGLDRHRVCCVECRKADDQQP